MCSPAPFLVEILFLSCSCSCESYPPHLSFRKSCSNLVLVLVPQPRTPSIRNQPHQQLTPKPFLLCFPVTVSMSYQTIDWPSKTLPEQTKPGTCHGGHLVEKMFASCNCWHEKWSATERRKNVSASTAFVSFALKIAATDKQTWLVSNCLGSDIQHPMTISINDCQ